jgi:LCP family protein required for cell wall assembly
MLYCCPVKFDKALSPRNSLARVLVFFMALWALVLCISVAVIARPTITADAQALFASPVPSVTALVWPPTPTLTTEAPVILESATLPPTATPVAPIASPTEIVVEIPASPEPTATWFYVVPAQPSAVPTPDLPAAAPFPGTCDGPGRMNIALIGIDGFNNNYFRAARADTIIVLGVNFAQKSANMLSIPRDLWVPLPGLSSPPEGRINTSYHYGELYQVEGGGPGELKAVLANTFGLRIDRYVVVSFSAFEQGIDTIGGVDINVAKPIHDDRYPLRDGTGTIAIDFPAGQVHMDGATALIYARTRHDSSDFQRMRRQQQVLYAVRNRLISPGTLPQLPALAQLLVSSARTDLSFEDLALLGCLGPQIGDAIQSWVIDGNMVRGTRLADGAQVLLPQMDAILPVLEQFNLGE